MIEHNCPNCGGSLENSESFAGESIECRHCRVSLVVPDAVHSSSPASVPVAPKEPIIDRIGLIVGAHVSSGAPNPLPISKRVLLCVSSPMLIAVVGNGWIYLIYCFWLCHASESWPTVQGRIERVGVRQQADRSPQGRIMITTNASIVYQYTVDGKERTSSQMAFGPRDTYAFLARAQADQYEPGQQVTVYYDPAHPDEAVLRREIQLGGYFFGLAGFFLTCIGARIFLVGAVPVVGSSNSRWLPWSYRVTWPDLAIIPSAVVAILLLVSTLVGI